MEMVRKSDSFRQGSFPLERRAEGTIPKRCTRSHRFQGESQSH